MYFHFSRNWKSQFYVTFSHTLPCWLFIQLQHSAKIVLEQCHSTCGSSLAWIVTQADPRRLPCQPLCPLLQFSQCNAWIDRMRKILSKHESSPLCSSEVELPTSVTTTVIPSIFSNTALTIILSPLTHVHSFYMLFLFMHSAAVISFYLFYLTIGFLYVLPGIIAKSYSTISLIKNNCREEYEQTQLRNLHKHIENNQESSLFGLKSAKEIKNK